MIEFIEQYFIKPIYTSEGYNIYNTLIYGALFLTGAYGVARLLKRLNVKTDEKLFFAVLPFVVLGGIMRALEEFARIAGAGLLPVSALFLTPGIYLLVASLAIVSLTAAVYLRKLSYASTTAAIGWLLVVTASPLLLYDLLLTYSGSTPTVPHHSVFLFIIALAAAITLTGVKILKRLGIGAKENVVIFSGFALEVSAVTLAVYLLGYTAAQPETRALLSHGIYPLFKLGLILLIMRFVEGVPREDEAHWLSKLILLVLGLPHGIHNSLQVLMGV